MLLVLLLGCLCMGGSPGWAQEGRLFHARLSTMPVDFETAASISGSGSVTGVLVDHQLHFTGSFAGTSSPASSAHVHRAPRGRRGPPLFEIDVSSSANGVIGGSAVLTDAQVTDLLAGNLYVQVHTETNPAGEIRGWLLPVESSP